MHGKMHSLAVRGAKAALLTVLKRTPATLSRDSTRKLGVDMGAAVFPVNAGPFLGMCPSRPALGCSSTRSLCSLRIDGRCVRSRQDADGGEGGSGGDFRSGSSSGLDFDTAAAIMMGTAGVAVMLHSAYEVFLLSESDRSPTHASLQRPATQSLSSIDIRSLFAALQSVYVCSSSNHALALQLAPCRWSHHPKHDRDGHEWYRHSRKRSLQHRCHLHLHRSRGTMERLRATDPERANSGPHVCPTTLAHDPALPHAGLRALSGISGGCTGFRCVLCAWLRPRTLVLHTRIFIFAPRPHAFTSNDSFPQHASPVQPPAISRKESPVL